MSFGTDTILTMADGHGVDLNAVTEKDIVFRTLSEHVAKEARFNGATAGQIYFVGQHLELGTRAMLSDGRSETEAAYFHLHDVQEGLWKDDPTPKKVTLARRIQEKCGVLASRVIEVIDEIIDEHDAAIYRAAGLEWPMPPDIKMLVKQYDKRMFVTEWQQLMGDRPHPNWSPYADIKPIDVKIECWAWERAHRAWFARACLIIPSLKKRIWAGPLGGQV